MIYGKPDPVPVPAKGNATASGQPAASSLAAPAAKSAAAAVGAGAAAGAGAVPSPAVAGDRQPATIRYVDRPDMEETFVDSVSGLIFDGQTLRIEFGVTRFDEVKPNAPISGRRYPACRLVLPPAAAVDLINRMQQIANALTQAGVVKPAPRTDTPKS